MIISEIIPKDNFILIVKNEDNISGEFDVSPYLESEAFAPLKQNGNFERIINGGYFVFNRKFFRYLRDDDACVLERDPLEKLAFDGELKVFQHKGFWQCMDTMRDLKFLDSLWSTGTPPWKTW